MTVHTPLMRNRHTSTEPDWTGEATITEPGSHVDRLRPSLPDLFDVEKRTSTIRLSAEGWELLVLGAKLGAGTEMPYVEAVLMSVESQVVGDPADVTLSELDWAALIVAARGARAAAERLGSGGRDLPELRRVLTSCADQLASHLPHPPA